MARYDVFPHPDTQLRKKTPYLLDIQNSHIDKLATRVVIPLRKADVVNPALTVLNPSFVIAEETVVLDTAALGAFPSGQLKNCVLSLRSESMTITAALHQLFGSH
jgi:toxin CcdB